ncbi:hypothetical protein C0J52_25491 [Blattella germanica]|nr:hypothetical protein C0J52_25491 [Blattella germanica]
MLLAADRKTIDLNEISDIGVPYLLLLKFMIENSCSQANVEPNISCKISHPILKDND